MKMFIAGLLTESCTFSPYRTTLADFERAKGGKLLGGLIGEIFVVFRTEAEAQGWTVSEGLGAGAVPGGIMTAATFASLQAELLADLDAVLPVDAVVLVLHGAMVADGTDDCEGEILRAVRQRVGPTVPIGVEIDPHANLSAEMVRSADILVSFKEWPHIDILDRAKETVLLTMDCAAGRIRPTAGVWDCRMIDLYHTLEEPMKSIIDRLRDVERRGVAVTASIVHGYPYCDVADMGTKVLVITNNQLDKANRLAREIGEALFALRGRTRPAHLSLKEGIDAVERAAHWPVVVADTADAPGGGAAGDATYLLRALIERGVTGVAVAYIDDPIALSLAAAAGIGARLPLRIGGKMGPASGSPLDLNVEVVGVFPDAVVDGDDRKMAIGDIVLVRTEGMEILLSKQRPVAMTASHFERFGIDPRQRRVLIVKSVNNFRAGFEAVAGQFVYIAGPGALDSSFKSYDWKKIKRPKWPMDNDPFPAQGIGATRTPCELGRAEPE
jgi:microcystin degradation protein MlrC